MLLENQQVLVVEDDFLIALDVAESVREVGAEVLGPAASVNAALKLLATEAITVAILDINLGKDVSLDVAEKLKQNQIPFIYHTGRNDILASSNWADAPIVVKPALPSILVAAVADSIGK